MGWLKSEHVIAAIIAGVFGAAVSFATIYWVALPQSKSEARLAAAQAIESTVTTAKEKIQLEKAKQPILQVTPRIRKKSPVRDISEFGIELLMENKGDVQITIDRIDVVVADGAAQGPAAQVIVDTEEYFLRRVGHAAENGGGVMVDPAPLFDTPIKPSDPPLIPDTNPFADETGGQILPLKNPRLAPLPPAPLDPPREASRAAKFEYEPARKNDPTGVQSDGALAVYYAKHLPEHNRCPHGQVIALSSTSPDIKWTVLPRATQSVIRPTVLRPSQSISQAFSYLLTEYPLHQHYQWLRYRVSVFYKSEKSTMPECQEYDCIISGLGAMSAFEETRTVSYAVAKPSPERDGEIIWQPSAPMMPNAPANE